MKRIIYTAVALIICASVFGIADYYNASKQGKLVDYKDEAAPSEAVISEKEKAIPATLKEDLAETKKEFIKESKSEKKATKRKSKKITQTVTTDVVTVNEIDPLIEKMDIMELLQSKTTQENTDTTVKEKTEKRTLKMEMFSRAPIREKEPKRKPATK